MTKKIELSITEAEVIKVAPGVGDTLIFKFKGDEFLNENLDELGAQLRKLFPANKVVVLCLPSGHDIELTTVQKPSNISIGDCSAPTSYCSSCNCGKKERIEGKKK